MTYCHNNHKQSFLSIKNLMNDPRVALALSEILFKYSDFKYTAYMFFY